MAEGKRSALGSIWTRSGDKKGQGIKPCIIVGMVAKKEDSQSRVKSYPPSSYGALVQRVVVSIVVVVNLLSLLFFCRLLRMPRFLGRFYRYLMLYIVRCSISLAQWCCDCAC